MIDVGKLNAKNKTFSAEGKLVQKGLKTVVLLSINLIGMGARLLRAYFMMVI